MKVKTQLHFKIVKNILIDKGLKTCSPAYRHVPVDKAYRDGRQDFENGSRGKPVKSGVWGLGKWTMALTSNLYPQNFQASVVHGNIVMWWGLRKVGRDGCWCTLKI